MPLDIYKVFGPAHSFEAKRRDQTYEIWKAKSGYGLTIGGLRGLAEETWIKAYHGHVGIRWCGTKRACIGLANTIAQLQEQHYAIAR